MSASRKRVFSVFKSEKRPWYKRPGRVMDCVMYVLLSVAIWKVAHGETAVWMVVVFVVTFINLFVTDLWVQMVRQGKLRYEDE